ncbi:MAG: hypothetical protein WBF77_13285 [Sulfurimonadaceae bacterium]
MNKLKIVAVLIVLVAIALALLFSYTSYQNKTNSSLLNTINEQKAFTQEVAKDIFYIYKNKNASTEQLDASIRKFLSNLKNKDETLYQIDSVLIQNESDKILLLWNDFYKSVQNFRDQNRVTTAYSNIVLEEIVKDIYNRNLTLVVEFNKLIKMQQEDFQSRLESYKNIQYMLFFILGLLLLYLFIQLQNVIAFIQKFLKTSKSIITNSSIKALKPIEVTNKSADIAEATNNFNFLVHKINDSIYYASNAIEHSYQSLEEVEKSIEDLLELLSIMEEDSEIDKELTKKEDALIHSFEELANSAQKLKELKSDLDLLTSPDSFKKQK